MDAHTVTVVFDDAKAKSDDFVKALSDAGFSTTGATKAP